MTRTTNARLAGFTFLFYIATGVTSLVLFNQATRAEGIAAKLARIAQHAPDVRATVVLSLLMCAAALVLGVTLYRLTRDEDPDLAMLALTCRVTEGEHSAVFSVTAFALLSVAMGAAGAAAQDAAAANALGALLLRVKAWTPNIGATVFAVGSLLYSYLFLRARSIPVPLAWLGIVASVLLVLLLPAQLAGWIGSPVTDFMWLPMLVFEVVFALWLLIKGVAGPEPGA